MRDDTTYCLDVMRTPMPKLPKISDTENGMQLIAETVARGEAEDELADRLLEIKTEAEEGLYWHVKVNMRGVSGNALVIVGTVKRALQMAGAPADHIQAFVGFALCDDYQNVLDTCSKWVRITDEPIQDTPDAFAAFKNRS
jgi:hypothetical protein